MSKPLKNLIAKLSPEAQEKLKLRSKELSEEVDLSVESIYEKGKDPTEDGFYYW